MVYFLIRSFSAAFDPHTKVEKEALEKVQNRGIRFIARDPRRHAPVTQYKEQYGIPPLEKRRRFRRLVTFHRYSQGKLAINHLPPLQLINSDVNRHATRLAGNHPFVIHNQFLPNKNYLRESYLYRTVMEWNQLDEDIACAQDTEAFKTKLGISMGLIGP